MNEERYLEPDVLLLVETGAREQSVHLIMEIEESGIEPVKICGKFLAAALSSHYIGGPEEEPVPISDGATFVQVLDTASLNIRKSSKSAQWRNLELAIRRILPLPACPIRSYKLFAGNLTDFAGPTGAELREYVAGVTSSASS